MSAEQRAFENLQRLAMQFKGIIDIAPELAALGSLKNAKAEAQAALDHVRALMVEERNRHAEALAVEREKIIAVAHCDAAGIRSEAEAAVVAAQAQLTQLTSRIKEQQVVEADWLAKAGAAKTEHDRIVSDHQHYVSKVSIPDGTITRVGNQQLIKRDGQWQPMQ